MPMKTMLVSFSSGGKTSRAPRKLSDDFRLSQVTPQAQGSGAAKTTSHGAADLAGNTEGVMSPLRNENAFHVGSVLELPQKLDGTVLRFSSPAADRTIDQGFFPESLSEGPGQIGHFLKNSRPRSCTAIS